MRDWLFYSFLGDGRQLDNRRLVVISWLNDDDRLRQGLVVHNRLIDDFNWLRLVVQNRLLDDFNWLDDVRLWLDEDIRLLLGRVVQNWLVVDVDHRLFFLDKGWQFRLSRFLGVANSICVTDESSLVSYFNHFRISKHVGFFQFLL